jgi:hypothetical protein
VTAAKATVAWTGQIASGSSRQRPNGAGRRARRSMEPVFRAPRSAKRVGQPAYPLTARRVARERGSRRRRSAEHQRMETAASRLTIHMLFAATLLEAVLLALEFAVVI